MIVSCHECGQPVEYRSSWDEPAKEFNTVDLAELRRERKRQTFARTAQFLLEGNR